MPEKRIQTGKKGVPGLGMPCACLTGTRSWVQSPGKQRKRITSEETSLREMARDTFQKYSRPSSAQKGGRQEKKRGHKRVKRDLK